MPALDETVAIGGAFVAPVVEEPLPHRRIGLESPRVSEPGLVLGEQPPQRRAGVALAAESVDEMAGHRSLRWAAPGHDGRRRFPMAWPQDSGAKGDSHQIFSDNDQAVHGVVWSVEETILPSETAPA